MKRETSDRLWQEAQAILPGGVNSPVRAFKSVGGSPFFVRSGKGACLTDADGNMLIDYVLSWGPLAVGHTHPEVVDAVKASAEHGFGFGIPTELETRLAQNIRRHFPAMERLRFVSSGTEAVMSAIRLARGYTQREIIVKMEGCYHGHADSLLAKAGSGVATLGLPDSPGVPRDLSAKTVVIPYNCLQSAGEVFSRFGDDIACVIVEPVAGNMGVVLPRPGYLEGLHALTRDNGALLIFDEVMTGFRVALGGAQARYGITPDLTTLGKVIGGGMPVGAYGGRKDIMDHLAPDGPIYQAGTLSGNPMAMTAGLKTLEILERPGIFQAMETHMTALCEGLGSIARENGIPVYQTRAGSMACLFFTEQPVHCYADAKTSDTRRYAAWFHAMLERGVYFAPSQFEAAFVSTAHDSTVVSRTLDAARDVMERGI